jgi:hypothetical protein
VDAVIRHFIGREPHPGEVDAIAAACPSAEVLIEAVLRSPEYASHDGDRADGGDDEPRLVNVWHGDFASWTRPPGTESPDGVAIVGFDGYLFLREGTNKILDQFEGRLMPPDGWLESWQRTIEERRRDPVHSGLTVVSVVMPDQLAFLADKYPVRLSTAVRPVQRLLDAGVELLYPSETLSADRELVSRRTDSHLSSAGSHAVYEAVRRQIPGAPPVAIPDLVPTLSLGDLGSRFAPVIFEVVQRVGSLGPAAIVEDNWQRIRAGGGYTGTRRVFKNPAAPDSRCVAVFGDSHAFASDGDDANEGLCFWLSQAFAEVHFLWAPFGWNAEYVEAINADIVIHEIAERFLIKVPETVTAIGPRS